MSEAFSKDEFFKRSAQIDRQERMVGIGLFVLLQGIGAGLWVADQLMSAFFVNIISWMVAHAFFGKWRAIALLLTLNALAFVLNQALS